MTEEELKQEIKAEYLALAHAMQSGVATEMQLAQSGARRHESTEPKHLRVGINAAMVDHGSLVSLLVKRGIITEVEYLRALRDGMREEVKRYEKRLSDLLGGKPVKLG